MLPISKFSISHVNPKESPLSTIWQLSSLDENGYSSGKLGILQVDFVGS